MFHNFEIISSCVNDLFMSAIELTDVILACCIQMKIHLFDTYTLTWIFLRQLQGNKNHCCSAGEIGKKFIYFSKYFIEKYKISLD